MALTRNFWDDLVDLDRPLGEGFGPFAFPWWRPRYAELTTELPYVPAVDVFSRNGDLVVHAELPGIDPARDVKVTLDNGILGIKGERKEEKEVEENGYHRKERVYGAFERRIAVPKTVKDSDIEADYKDGVLEVVVIGAGKPISKPAAKEIPVHKKEPLPVKG
jgi:HSP20 family protein